LVALINPNYTPVHLVQGAKLIVRFELGAPDAEGNMAAVNLQALQGEAPPGLSFHVGGAAIRRAVSGAFGSKRQIDGILLSGDFGGAAGREALAGRDTPVGVLHVGSSWFGLYGKPGGKLEVSDDPFSLRTVWAGGSEMLVRAITYVKADPRADFPVMSHASWREIRRIGNPGKHAASCDAIDLGDGRLILFVASADGDRFFCPDQFGNWTEGTTAHLLETRSLATAWGDFDGDGRIDLASWDGASIRLLLQGSDGGFSQEAGASHVIEACRGLASIGVGDKGRAGLLISQDEGPTILQFKNRRWEEHSTMRVLGGINTGADGIAGACLVADFDGDGLADIIQPRANGLLLFCGSGTGEFAAPVSAGRFNSRGEGVPVAWAGDFDGDGALDLLVTVRGSEEDYCLIYANQGGGHFVNVLGESGEPAYVSKPGVAAIGSGDFNSDGREDYFVLYPGMGPQLYFNRGFRCFGYSADLEFGSSGLEGEHAIFAGQQAGCLADLDGDGAQDLAVVTAGGELWVAFRDASKGSNNGVVVALPAGVAGPLSIMARDGDKEMGTRVATAAQPAYFGKSGKGPLELIWKYPDASSQTKRLIILKPTRVILPSPVTGSKSN